MALDNEEVYRSISTMLDAGLSITKALTVASRNAKGRTRHALGAAIDAIEGGDKLTDSLRRSPKVFSEADMAIVEAGEDSGRLSESFVSLANLYHLKSSTWRAIKSGLALPLVQLHAAAFILPVPALFLNKVELSGYLMSVFSFLLITVYGPISVVLAISRMCEARGRVRRAIDPILLKVPLLGSALRDMAYARYCATFHALYEAGVGMPRCADTAVTVCGNAVVASKLDGGARSASDGNPVSEGFSNDLPPEFIEPWKTGEEAGRLAETLTRLSAQYLERGERTLGELGRWLPRVIGFLVILLLAVLILGSFVGR